MVGGASSFGERRTAKKFPTARCVFFVIDL